MWAWPGSRDDDNSTVQTAAMGQIPRSTERILVAHETTACEVVLTCRYAAAASAQKYSSRVVNTYTFGPKKWRFLQKK